MALVPAPLHLHSGNAFNFGCATASLHHCIQSVTWPIPRMPHGRCRPSPLVFRWVLTEMELARHRMLDHSVNFPLNRRLQTWMDGRWGEHIYIYMRIYIYIYDYMIYYRWTQMNMVNMVESCGICLRFCVEQLPGTWSASELRGNEVDAMNRSAQHFGGLIVQPVGQHQANP